jgi:hypothetical protein
VKVLNDLVEIPAGQSRTVTVYVRPTADGCAPVDFTSTSEGDTTKSATATSVC